MSQGTALPTADLHHPAIDAAMATAADLLGMQAVFIGGLTDDDFFFERIYGELPGITEGDAQPRENSFCHRLLAGGPAATADASTDPAYSEVPCRTVLGIMSYVGVPLETGRDGVAGTLCGVDRDPIEVGPQAVGVMRDLAHVVEAHIVPLQTPVIRRDGSGWRVGSAEEPDLLSAMVLADLLDPPAPPTGSPAAASPADGEQERLRSTVRQLEHALGARVLVEQAIGVLAERQRIAPRQAFERLRRAARSRGRKVQELAREIVASTSDPTVPLPPELGGRR
jgi:hypothetical protein